ncbi:unnamed protein product [Schistocephalus solidus]|uniref:Methyltransf_FA domain-containing protein n=1 Tax=Schistocephalus solidus TaxID=70667 RepID=A0A183T8U0_SCHSO|nr:unnamed protein product [Schistocephalus solidus]
MLLVLLLSALTSGVFGATHQSQWCNDKKNPCQISYAPFDRYLDHVLTSGTCTFVDDKNVKIEVHKKTVEVRKMRPGAYLCVGQNKQRRLFVFGTPPDTISIVFDPMLPSVHFARGTYTALLSLKVPRDDKFFHDWLASVRKPQSKSRILLNGQPVNVQTGHEGFVRIIPPYDHQFMELQNQNATMKLNEGFPGTKGVYVTSLTHEERFRFTLTKGFKEDDSKWCVDGRYVCNVAYAHLDKYLSHYQTTGYVSFYGRGPRFNVRKDSPTTHQMQGGIYRVFHAGVPKEHWLILYST